MRPERTGYGVQVASMESYEGALKKVAELQEDFYKNILVSIENGKNGVNNYKVILGPFPDKDTAQSYKKHTKKKKLKGFVIDLSKMKAI